MLWRSPSYGFSFRPSRGASSGLLILWDINEVEIFYSFSFDHVLAIGGRFLQTGEDFVLFNVYAPCDVGGQSALWGTLSSHLANLQGHNVCVCGDFNVVRRLDERRGVGAVPRVVGVSTFNNFVDDSDFIDLPLIGRRFTWYRGDGLSMSRLDRFLLSENWCLRWPNCIQVAQLRGFSDHCDVILLVDEQNWGPRPCRMLKCWADVPGYKNIVSPKWWSFQVEGWGGYVMKEKFKMIKEALKEWHSNHTNNLPGKIALVKDRIAVLDDRGVVASLGMEEVEELHRLIDNLHSLSRIHSSMCWQQSRLTWLREGDANTKYFHGTMSSRRRVNTISSIVVGGTVVEGVSNVRQAVYTHFLNHFLAPSVERPSASDLNFRTLTYREGAAIIKLFTMEELKIAVWDCDSYKCPRPDGVNFGFIKEFWLDMREKLMHYVSDFHRNGKLLKGINSTFITLIPKKDVPQSLNDFRPISLVGSLYKVMAKLLANRLKSVIRSVILDSQSAFVQGRQILDGILVANEVVDEAKKLKKDLLLLKVDFEKAYDSVDWKYLDDVMGKMTFPTLWRKWMRECVTTATALVLVNGSPTDEFSLARGLRQGDPLSPFLFLLAAEGFHVLMDSLNTNN